MLPHKRVTEHKEKLTGAVHTTIEYFWIVDKARDGNEGAIPMNFLGAEARWLERGANLGDIGRSSDFDRAPNPEPDPPADDGDEPLDLLDYAEQRLA